MPTSPKGTVLAEHVWKRFRADRSLPLFQEQIKVLGKWMKGERRDFRWVLREVNMHVEPGKTYGIIGVNGSGAFHFVTLGIVVALLAAMGMTLGGLMYRQQTGTMRHSHGRR